MWPLNELYPPGTLFGPAIFNTTPPQKAAELRRWAYYASVSFLDLNVGKVLDELNLLGLGSNTAVVLTSDHGYMLGENWFWEKMSNFEGAVRVPVIIRAPWIPQSAGKRVGTVLFELVDLFPTLAGLAELPNPSEPTSPWPEPGLNGTDLSATLERPDDFVFHETALKPGQTAFSQFAKVAPRSKKNRFRREETQYMGYSVRTRNWRYTCWFTFDQKLLRPNLETPITTELYDYRDDWGDPNWPLTNLARLPQYAAETEKLHQILLSYVQL